MSVFIYLWVGMLIIWATLLIHEEYRRIGKMKVVYIGSLRWKIGVAIKEFGERRHSYLFVALGNAIKWGRR